MTASPLIDLGLLVEIWCIWALDWVAHRRGGIVLFVNLSLFFNLIVKVDLLLMDGVELLHSCQRLHEVARGVRPDLSLISQRVVAKSHESKRTANSGTISIR